MPVHYSPVMKLLSCIDQIQKLKYIYFTVILNVTVYISDLELSNQNKMLKSEKNSYLLIHFQ